jgi:hypothetical protein
MTSIPPTVGRVVWFTPSRLTGDYGFTHIDSRKPLAAIVSHVFSDELVNLAVFLATAFPTAEPASSSSRRARPSPNTAISASGCPTRSGRPRRQPTTRNASSLLSNLLGWVNVSAFGEIDHGDFRGRSSWVCSTHDRGTVRKSYRQDGQHRRIACSGRVVFASQPQNEKRP